MSYSKLYDFDNRLTYDKALGRVFVAAAAHPFDYVKTLIQLGFEPMPPIPVKTLFGRQRLGLPGVFKYLGHIRRTDGFFGMYRGISYKISTALINGFVYENVNHRLKQWYPSEPPATTQMSENGVGIDSIQLKKLCIYLSRETVSRFAAQLIAYPFHLMTVRCCAQFIGGEHYYDSLSTAVADIYQTGGITAFYSGFWPRFLYDCMLLWVGSSIIYFVNCWIGDSSAVKSYVSASVNFILASFLYPFQLVSTVMSCNGYNARSLAASTYTGPEYTNWVDCWQNLSQLGQLKRGSSLLWRYTTHLTSSPHYSNRNYKSLNLKEW